MAKKLSDTSRRIILRKKNRENNPHGMSSQADEDAKKLAVQRHSYLAGYNDGLAGIKKSEIPDYVAGLFTRAKFLGILEKAEELYRSGLAVGYGLFKEACKG